MKIPGLEKALYGLTKEEALREGKCIRCKHPVISGLNVYSPAGAAEYKVSGLCEDCFDAITGENL
jgi:hypothetical protein